MDPHRSIQDIIPPARSKPIRSSMPGTVETPPREPPLPPPTPPQEMDLNPRRPSGFFGFAIVAAGVLVLLGIFVAVASTIFYRAYITATPYRFTANVQGSYEARLLAAAGSDIPYQKITATDTVTKSVPATGTEQVQNHSSGSITIYNAYTSASQRLITNTRFATKDGLIFRIHTPVVVPGYTMKAGIKAPGTIDAVVYADQAGDTYNIGATDFTIPGLKGSKQYTLMYAKSKVVMSGGFIGEQAVVNPALRTQTVETLKGDLDRSLRAKIIASVPSGTVIFKDTVAITYTVGNDVADGSNAVISVSGTAAAPAVNTALLVGAFAKTSNISYAGLLSVENPNALTVSVDHPENVGTDRPIKLNVSGAATLVSIFDQTQLTHDLAGKSKNDIKSVLPEYPGISNITVKIYPFWRGSLPTDASRIKVEEPKALDASH